MKIASKSALAFCFSTTALALILGISGASSARADDNSAARPLPTAVAENSASAKGIDPLENKIASSESTLPALPASAKPAPASKSLDPLEDKVTDSAKNVVKQLGTVDNLSLEDLNAARLTVVKLDILIDIEKHLAELDKLHHDKDKESKSLASAIPASALVIPPQFGSAVTRSAASEIPIQTSVPRAHLSVEQISGADGHFTAIISGKTVRVGDHLSDGSTIVAITAQQVTAKAKGGALNQLKVNGVNEVHGRVL